MEEKMLILKMLQEGKINADEAVKLLDALEKSGIGTEQAGSRRNDFKDEFAAKLNDMKIDERLNKFGEKATRIAETLGEKAGKLAEQLGENINHEKISSNTEKFTEEFTKRMESLGQDIAESASKFSDIFASQLGTLFENSYEKYRYNSSYTYPVTEAFSLYLKTGNFSVSVAPSDSSDIKVNIYVSSNIPQLVTDDFFKVIKESGCYRLTSEFPGRTRGRIELQLPKDVDVLSVSTDNARCEVNGLEVHQLNCSTSNGRVIVTGSSAESLELLTDNERVILSGVSARIANIRTSNSKITIENCHLDNIDAKTSNAAITASVYRKGDSVSSGYSFNTTNGRLDIGLGVSEETEHQVNAHTTMGSIDISLPGLTYTMDKKDIGMESVADIKSDSFDTASCKLIVRAVTTNAPVNIQQL
ncbi:MAG TPA: DUF4097 family beta strand repeat-containing protein [Clostridia bacterium]|nr:DUF4097 family beta strand repeat-containing protein [Clostridia bacterium]